MPKMRTVSEGQIKITLERVKMCGKKTIDVRKKYSNFNF